MPDASIRRAAFDSLSLAGLHELLKLRADVFVVEQASPYPDIDGRDPGALHLLATDGSGALVGCARCLGPEAGGHDAGAPGGGTVSFGRLAVAPSQRSTGLGRRLVAECLAVLAERWSGRDVVIGAQSHLQRFYGGFGFLPFGEIYDDGGIPHIDMRLRGR